MTNTKTIDLARLTQAQVAWLLNRSPRFLREHSDWFQRDADGRYDARKAVIALIENLPPQVEFVDNYIGFEEYLEMSKYVRDQQRCRDCKAGRECEFHKPRE